MPTLYYCRFRGTNKVYFLSQKRFIRHKLIFNTNSSLKIIINSSIKVLKSKNNYIPKKITLDTGNDSFLFYFLIQKLITWLIEIINDVYLND